MPYYHKMGRIPRKRHTVFRKPDGELYAEELVSTEGFSSLYSLAYHCHPPTLVQDVSEPVSPRPKSPSKTTFGTAAFAGFRRRPPTIIWKAAAS